MSEPGATCGPGQPEHVWSRVHVANMLGTDSPQTGSASVAAVGWGTAGLGWHRQRDGGVLLGTGPVARGGQRLSKWTVKLLPISALQRRDCSSPCGSWVSSWAGRGPLSSLQTLTCPVEGKIPSCQDLATAWKPQREGLGLEVGGAKAGQSSR